MKAFKETLKNQVDPFYQNLPKFYPQHPRVDTHPIFFPCDSGNVLGPLHWIRSKKHNIFFFLFHISFLDSGLVFLKIKTDCGIYSHSKDKKTFTFCQNGRCCSTGGLPAQDEKCKQNIYYPSQLGECRRFHFDFESVQGNVTYHDLASASDGWTPDVVKLVLGNGNVIKCSFYESLGGIKTHLTGEWEGDEPTSMNFQCEPEGNVLFLF